MNPFARRSFGNRKRTQADKRAALVSRLAWCRDLDGLTSEQLARETGLPVAVCGAALDEQRKHREVRGE
jgi:DNA-binding transcriptional regulator LsrR (DeoR family)